MSNVVAVGFLKYIILAKLSAAEKTEKDSYKLTIADHVKVKKSNEKCKLTAVVPCNGPRYTRVKKKKNLMHALKDNTRL